MPDAEHKMLTIILTPGAFETSFGDLADELLATGPEQKSEQNDRAE